MSIYFLGGTTTLSSSGTDTIRLRIPCDGEIIAFLVNSTGRCKITNMEISGYGDFFEGSLEITQLKVDGSKYVLEEPIPVEKGQDFVISLEDISGASNTVYFACVIRRR